MLKMKLTFQLAGSLSPTGSARSSLPPERLAESGHPSTKGPLCFLRVSPDQVGVGRLLEHLQLVDDRVPDPCHKLGVIPFQNGIGRIPGRECRIEPWGKITIFR